MIMVPDWVTVEMFDQVGSDAVRLESLSEGRCVQALHVGSYDDEADVLRRTH